jgi:hypothetical protein
MGIKNQVPSALKDFFLNEGMRHDVKAYLLEFLQVEALQKLGNREDASGFADAKETIEKAFDNLETLFASKSEVKEVKNEAR